MNSMFERNEIVDLLTPLVAVLHIPIPAKGTAMTMPAPEFLESEETQYFICGFDGTNQFEPETIGIKVEGGSTACYRGWFANWCLSDGRLYLLKLTIYSNRVPPICAIKPEISDSTSIYENLMLPSGFSGTLTVIPAEDRHRAHRLYYCIPDKDEIVPRFGLFFNLGRLKTIENTSYLLQSNEDEDEPGERSRAGRIFHDVPTPFDSLVYRHFNQWE